MYWRWSLKVRATQLAHYHWRIWRSSRHLRKGYWLWRHESLYFVSPRFGNPQTRFSETRTKSFVWIDLSWVEKEERKEAVQVVLDSSKFKWQRHKQSVPIKRPRRNKNKAEKKKRERKLLEIEWHEKPDHAVPGHVARNARERITEKGDMHVEPHSVRCEHRGRRPERELVRKKNDRAETVRNRNWEN